MRTATTMALAPSLAIMGCALGLAAQSAAAARVEAAQRGLTQAEAQLAQIKVDPDTLAYHVLPPARPLLTEVKHRLLDLIEAEVAAEPLAGATAWQAELRRRVQNLALGDYGKVSRLEIAQPPGHPRLLVVVTGLGIVCGEDDSLYLFRRQGAGWVLMYRSERDGYGPISDADGILQYAVSPPRADGRWYMVISYSPPWCTSVWQGLSYEALVASPRGTELTRVLKVDTGMYLGNVTGRLRVGKRGFAITYQARQTLDMKDLLRTALAVWRLHGPLDGGRHFVRTPQVATGPLGFLSYWAGAARDVAQPLTTPAAHDQADAAHLDLRSWWGSGLPSLSDFRLCRSGAHSVRLSLTNEAESAPPQPPWSYYFLITGSGFRFQIAGVSKNQFAGCDTPLPWPPKHPLADLGQLDLGR